jgi:CRP/FNR family nitrogen fixation transcriptional regulator
MPAPQLLNRAPPPRRDAAHSAWGGVVRCSGICKACVRISPYLILTYINGRELSLINIDRTILGAAKLPTVELHYRRRETVYEQGALAQFVYLVDQGSLCRFGLMAGDRRSIRQLLFPGDGFGYEIGRHHRDTVQALTPIKVLAVARDALVSAAKSDVRLSNLLFSAAARAALAAEEAADTLRVRTATEQIAQFLLEMEVRLSKCGIIDLPMSRSQIGDYFGLRIETVSRAISAFQKEKIIQFRDRAQRRVVIRDKRRLQQLASDASDFDYWSILKIRKTMNGRQPIANNEASAAR